MRESQLGGGVLQNREWHKVAGASAGAIAALKSLARADLPESYYSLLTFSNGGEGPLAVQPLWFQLYPAEEAAQIEGGGTFRELFEGLFVIGGNGAAKPWHSTCGKLRRIPSRPSTWPTSTWKKASGRLRNPLKQR